MTQREPAILTIFGITGDLARRKLLPALYNLAHNYLLPEPFKIVGLSRKDTTTQEIIDVIKASVIDTKQECDPATLQRLANMISIVHMDITNPGNYTILKDELNRLEDTAKVCMHRLFYLAIPSSLFEPIVERLGQGDLSTGCQHGTTESRLLIEKPFGYDTSSAEELINTLGKYFDEKQVYRIDHYLAKETVQNILRFRFENPLFHGAWNNKHISHIMITASGSIGIEGRVDFYEQMGALRDLVQSHLLQLVALVTMERPEAMDSASIHQAKAVLLNAIKPPQVSDMAEETVRGQYLSYRGEVSNPRSQTETYVALQLRIDNSRWSGVPIFMRTGKLLAAKISEVNVFFHNQDIPGVTNCLTIRIQPHEGIVLDVRIKKPGFEDEVQTVRMDYCYNELPGAPHPDAYERVLVDALRGDKTLFATSEEVLACWRISQPILHAWTNNLTPFEIYDNQSWGPARADEMVKKYDAEWPDSLHICSLHLINEHS